jgi:hypothetical protein
LRYAVKQVARERAFRSILALGGGKAHG